MKTPEEIKKGLEACKRDGDCDRGNCPYHSLGTGTRCIPAMSADALAYIQQIEDHIRDLAKKVERLESQLTAPYRQATMKEVAECLKDMGIDCCYEEE